MCNSSFSFKLRRARLVTCFLLFISSTFAPLFSDCEVVIPPRLQLGTCCRLRLCSLCSGQEGRQGAGFAGRQLLSASAPIIDAWCAVVPGVPLSALCLASGAGCGLLMHQPKGGRTKSQVNDSCMCVCVCVCVYLIATVSLSLRGTDFGKGCCTLGILPRLLASSRVFCRG